MHKQNIQRREVWRRRRKTLWRVWISSLCVLWKCWESKVCKRWNVLVILKFLFMAISYLLCRHKKYKSIVYGLMQFLFSHTSSPYLPESMLFTFTEWMLFTFTVSERHKESIFISPRKSSSFTQNLFNIWLYNIVSELKYSCVTLNPK